MRIHGMGFAFGPRPGVAGFASAYFMSFSSSGLRRASCSSFFGRDRKSTRLNSSHPSISYAVFCLKKKKYHALNQLAEYLIRVRNFNVSVKQVGDKIIFMRKLTEGGSDRSFGIRVAQLAGMPTRVG